LEGIYDSLRGTAETYLYRCEPWYVIPADKKWFMRAAISDIIVDKLKSLKLSYPKISKEQKSNLLKIKEMLIIEKENLQRNQKL